MSLLNLAVAILEDEGSPRETVLAQRLAKAPDPAAWTPRKLAAANVFFLHDKRSATDVAKLVGVSSRHAVLGVAFRNGWDRPPEVANENARKARQRRGRAPVEPPRTTRKRRFRPKTLLVRLPDPLPTLPEKPDTITIAPRHWLSREEGECAYPVSGSGADTLSCCNPCDARYCPPHRQIMYEPTRVSVSDLEHSLRKQL